MQKISSLASKLRHLPPPMVCEACCISPFQKVCLKVSSLSYFKIFHNNIFNFQSDSGLEVFLKKSAFIMILLRNFELISKAIISLNSSQSGGHFDILNFSVHENSKKLIYFFKNE